MSSNDVQTVMNEVRRRAWRRRREKAEFQRQVEQIVSPELGLALGNLDLQLEHLRHAIRLIGAMPPKAPGPRARFGAVLVALVRRALFWFIPTLQSSHAATLGALEAQYRALTEITTALRYINNRLLTHTTESSQNGSSRRGLE
ncbi:MAG: hypothetical protein ABSH47_10915 [Bryobacteraceae bacterium]|jgi:hypothetical protein